MRRLYALYLSRKHHHWTENFAIVLSIPLILSVIVNQPLALSGWATALSVTLYAANLRRLLSPPTYSPYDDPEDTP